MVNLRRQRHPRAWLALLAASMLALAALGCEVEEGQAPANRPPDTFLFVQADSVNTLHYRQILHWWGTDPDGEIEAYLFRLSGPWTPDPTDSIWADDPSWIWTQSTLDTFDIPVEGSFAERTFEVRAIDDEGLIDPSPATQVFRVKNFPPVISWSRELELPTRSLPATSFAWSPVDPDGRETVTRALLWIETGLPGDSARTVRVVEGDTVTSVLPEQFEFGVNREYTVKIQAIDDAATKSNILEHTWMVEWPTGDVLLIDNVDFFWVPGAIIDDGYHRGLVDEVTSGNLHIMDVPIDGGFRSGSEVFPLFQLFDAVIWYSGAPDSRIVSDRIVEGINDRSMRENLEKAEEGIASYLEAGGRILISSTNLFGDLGGLSPRFFVDVAGLDTLYRWANPAIGIATGMPLPEEAAVLVDPEIMTPGAGQPDTLRMGQGLLHVEYFSSPDSEDRLLWLAPATLDTSAIPQQRHSEFHCGVRRRIGPGRLVLTTFPLSRASLAGNHEAVGRALIEWLLEP